MRPVTCGNRPLSNPLARSSLAVGESKLLNLALGANAYCTPLIAGPSDTRSSQDGCF